MASIGYSWLQQQGNLLAEFYPLQWIAVDSGRIEANPRAIAEIVVATGTSLEDLMESLDPQYEPLTLFYAFIRTPLENHSREEGRRRGNQRFL
jgi:hypothetical protein